MKPEWISAIAESVTAALAFFVVTQAVLLKKQARLMKTQIDADHDRSRRQAAIEAVRIWTTNMTAESSSVLNLVDEFTEQQCKDLTALKPLEIYDDRSALVKSCLAKDETLAPSNNGKVCLTVMQVSQLRYGVLRYLNTLEAILVAWQHNIADQQIINEQFKYMFENKAHPIMANYRRVSGKARHSAYPAIEAFCKANAEHPTRVNPMPRIEA